MARDNSSPHSIPHEEELARETKVPHNTELAQEPVQETEVPQEEELAPEAAVPLEQQHWEQAQEEEWSEHTATAWTLAHIIHRIYSTPLPPVLSPEQRRHFQKIIKMAAALIEEWQQRERELAQQLASERHPPTFEEIQEAIEAEVASPPTRHPARQ